MSHAKSIHAKSLTSEHRERALLIDVRTAGEFAAEHIDGAINIPLDSLEAAAIHQLGHNDDTAIYLLCQGGRRAQLAAEKLAGQLKHDVFVVDGGLNACKEQGIATLHGSGVIALERQVRIAAGALVLTGVTIGALIAPAGYALSAFVGAGLIFAGITDTCAMGMLLARAPWNRGGKSSTGSAG